MIIRMMCIIKNSTEMGYYMNINKLQFGLDTFGEEALDSPTGKRSSFEESLRTLLKKVN